MKNPIGFSILFSMIGMFIISACENSEVQQSTDFTEKLISSRTEDCTDCPMEDCCCRITYVSGLGASLEICGSTGIRLSTRSCGPADPPGDDCPNVAATYYLGPFTIDEQNQYQVFCVPENASFMINAISGTVVVNLTCQHDQTPPQSISATLVGGNRYFFESDGDCELDTCPN